MRILTLLTFLLISTTALVAQTCIPDPLYADSTFGVYPAPYDEEDMEGGIEIQACIGEYYEAVLTAIVPSEVDIPGFPTVDINAITVEDDGVTGLPVGLNYACNPPNCYFEADKQGCVVVYGTPTSANAAGDYQVALELIIDTELLGPIAQPYPGPLFPGSYFITVNEEASACVVNTSDVLGTAVSFTASPNPLSNYTQIQLTANNSQAVSFEVYDLLGNQLYQKRVELTQGDNSIEFDANNLANGLYIYSIRNKDAIISKRMIVQK